MYEGSRVKGRPRTKWRDELERRVGTGWQRETRDRVKWRKISES